MFKSACFMSAPKAPLPNLKQKKMQNVEDEKEART